jgi:hypothetical protein
MKKMVILAMLVGFLSAESIDGFRNMRWGDGIEKLGNYTVVNNLGDTKRIIAIKNDDTLKIGDATLTKIEYHFFDNQFFAVSIQYQDYKTNDILIQTIEMKYGNLDYKNDKNIRKYVDGYKIQGDKIVENI